MSFHRAYVSFVCFQTIVAIGAMMPSAHAAAENSSLQPWLFKDPRCAYTVEFSNIPDIPPVMDRNANTVTQSGPGYQLSAACIVATTLGSIPLLQGAALFDHLTRLSNSIGILGAIITVPTSPASSCGLISGDIKNADGPRRIRTKFCYSEKGYLIVETVSDRSKLAEEAALAILQSVQSTAQ